MLLKSGVFVSASQKPTTVIPPSKPFGNCEDGILPLLSNVATPSLAPFSISGICCTLSTLPKPISDLSSTTVPV